MSSGLANAIHSSNASACAMGYSATNDYTSTFILLLNNLLMALGNKCILVGEVNSDNILSNSPFRAFKLHGKMQR